MLFVLPHRGTLEGQARPCGAGDEDEREGGGGEAGDGSHDDEGSLVCCVVRGVRVSAECVLCYRALFKLFLYRQPACPDVLFL